MPPSASPDWQFVIPLAENDHVAPGEPPSTPTWRHLELTDLSGAQGLFADVNKDPAVIAPLLAPETRPRLVPGANGVGLILRGINVNPGADPEDMVSVRIWAGPRQVITVTRRPVIAIAELAAVFQDASHQRPVAAEILVRVVERLSERIRQAVETLNERLDGLEEALLGASAPSSMHEDIKDIRRQAIWLRRFCEPQADALRDLAAAPPPWLGRAQSVRLRECADAHRRIVEHLGAIREHAIVIQDHLDSLAEQDSKRLTYFLTVVAGIFLPLNLVTGLLGANVGGVPGSDSPWGFIAMLASVAMLGAAGAVVFWRLK